MASGETGSFEVQRNRYLSIAFLCAGIWLLLFCGSQFGHLVSNRHGFGDLVLIRPDDTRVLFRRALFTQTTYLCACICIALFFRFFFREEWMRYVLWGAWFLALYGIYEWLFFLIFKRPGDFIANRMYGDHPGSWSQTMAVGPLTLLRIKSTFGEPSWFSASVIPYFFLALRNKRWWLCAALLFCIVFSTSTSAYIGFAFAFILYVLLRRRLNAGIVFAALLFAGSVSALCYVYPDTFNEMFTAKFRGENNSGQSRMEHGAAANEQAASFTFLNRLFGIGFGYHYGGVFFAVLMNTGWIGLLVYLYVFSEARNPVTHRWRWTPRSRCVSLLCFCYSIFLCLNSSYRRPGCSSELPTGTSTKHARTGLRRCNRPRVGSISFCQPAYAIRECYATCTR